MARPRRTMRPAGLIDRPLVEGRRVFDRAGSHEQTSDCAVPLQARDDVLTFTGLYRAAG
ncbi:hypothetical protein [Streptomyces sp. NPDC086989]|uniref:hypothetical protein n=1 Tax=Streptomyces sp. NPDC086989 TaxID=3365764 RepID=UPI00380F0D9B